MTGVPAADALSAVTEQASNGEVAAPPRSPRRQFVTETVPRLRQDPYSLYAEWMERGSVHGVLPGLWLVMGHADGTTVLKDSERFSNDYRKSRRWQIQSHSERIERISRAVGVVDPPDHTRLRNILVRFFSAPVIAALRPRVERNVEQLVEPLVERVRDGEAVDIVSTLAFPLPTAVIGDLLGVPPGDWPTLSRWSEDIIAAGDLFIPVEDMARGNRSAHEMAEYFLALGKERRGHPGEDLLSTLVRAWDDGRIVSEEEFLSGCCSLLMAGHKTTLNLIANGTAALLRHPAQHAMLREDPSLIRSAVEEVLRYDAPVQFMVRVAPRHVELQGHAISRGERVYVGLAASNRDPVRFDRADQLDITRRKNYHLSFGAGIHFCLGAHLARMEGQLAIGSLLSKLPGLELVEDRVELNNAINLRGFRRLPVALDGGPAARASAAR